MGEEAGHPRTRTFFRTPGPWVCLLSPGHTSPNTGARASLDPPKTMGPERQVAATSRGRGASRPHPKGLPGCFWPLRATCRQGAGTRLAAPSISRPVVTPGGRGGDNRDLHPARNPSSAA